MYAKFSVTQHYKSFKQQLELKLKYNKVSIWLIYPVIWSNKYLKPGPNILLSTLPTLWVCVWVCDPGSRCRGLVWPGCCPLSILVVYQALLPPLLLSFRIWAHAESPLHQNCWRDLVVFHTYHHLLLHGKPGSLPHCGEDGVTNWLCWWPG